MILTVLSALALVLTAVSLTFSDSEELPAWAQAAAGAFATFSFVAFLILAFLVLFGLASLMIEYKVFSNLFVTDETDDEEEDD